MSTRQEWASPRPVQLPSFPHPEPRAYHQMLRTWNYKWWKPVVGVIIAIAAMVIVAPLVMLAALAIGLVIEGGPFLESFHDAWASLQSGTGEPQPDIGPATLLAINLALGSLILSTWFVMRVVHRMRPRWLTSVVPKMRWKFLFICVGLSVIALVAQILVSLLLPGAQEADVTQKVNDFTATTAILAVIVLVTTPFQAAGEEYLFRGYLMQAVGSFWSFGWVSPAAAKWIAILVTSALFATAHGGQNFPLFFDRFMFGLIAGWLVIRTGGLEAGIAMHILNNFLAFGFALVVGDLTESLTVSETGWGNVPLTLVQAGTYALLVLFVSKKMNLSNMTNPPGRPPSQPVTSDAAPVPSGA